jgi:hypothetical protein
MAVTEGSPLRKALALLVGCSAALQISLLWQLPLERNTLAVALGGTVYLMLSLGLLGVSRLALFLALTLPAWRVLEGWQPLPVAEWETLRRNADLCIAGVALLLFWRARHAPTH